MMHYTMHSETFIRQNTPRVQYNIILPALNLLMMVDHRKSTRYKNLPKNFSEFPSDDLQNAQIESSSDAAPIVAKLLDGDTKRLRTSKSKRTHDVSLKSRRSHVPCSFNVSSSRTNHIV